MAGLCFAEFALEIMASLHKAELTFSWIQEKLALPEKSGRCMISAGRRAASFM
jgi:hypothetical protein